MFTTADLPESFRATDTDAALLRAVRASGLRLADCTTHRRADCPTCLIDAARDLVGEADAPQAVG